MKFARALQISTLAQGVQFALSLLSVVVVSRLLRAEEIGIFSVAVSLVGFAHVFREFGVGQYLIQAAEVRQAQFRAAFSVALGTSWAIGLLMLLASVPMARLYDNPGVGEVLAWSALNFAVMPFGTPLLSMLRRELRFDTIAWVSITGAVVQTAITIGAASLGQSYLSMVWGGLAGTVSKMLLLNAIRPGETFIRPSLHGVRDVLRFGALSSSTQIVYAVSEAAPDLVLGKSQGFAEAAFFSRGMSIQAMVVEKVNETVRSIHLPMFAAQVREGADPAALFCQVSSYLAVVTVPMLMLFALLADPLIVFAFGTQWERSAQLATVLCAGLCLSAPLNLYASSLVAAGRMGLLVKTTFLVQGVRIATLFVSFWLPLEGLAWALVGTYLFEALVAHHVLHGAFGLRAAQTFGFVAPAWAVGLISSTPPLLLKLQFGTSLGASGGTVGTLGFLAAASALAVAGWGMAIWALRHPIREPVRRMLRSVPTLRVR